MSVERNEEVINRYRVRALWGGVFVGGLVGAIGMAPFLRSMQSPALWYLGAIAGGALAGAGLGYLFFEIVIGHMAAKGPLHSGSAPASGASSADAGSGILSSLGGEGGGDGGDGGGGGD